MFGTLLGTRDAIPAFKEIIGFGQKVEHKCSVTISNTQGDRRCYLKQGMSSKDKGYCEREDPYPRTLASFYPGQKSRRLFCSTNPMDSFETDKEV